MGIECHLVRRCPRLDEHDAEEDGGDHAECHPGCCRDDPDDRQTDPHQKQCHQPRHEHRSAEEAEGQRGAADEQSDPDAQRGQDRTRHRIRRVEHGLLDRHGEADDAADEREVGEAVGVSGERASAARIGGREPMLERDLEPAEVGPPEQAGDDDRRTDRQDERG